MELEKTTEVDLEVDLEIEKALINKEKQRPKKVAKSGPDGCFCKACNQWFPMAEPNQTDGTLICWGCRN